MTLTEGEAPTMEPVREFVHQNPDPGSTWPSHRGSAPAPPHRERIVADPVRSLAIVIEGRQSELVRVYHGMERRLEGRPGVRITAWVDGERGSLSIAPRRPP